MEELKTIMEKYAASGWDLISVPAQQWLDGKADKDALVSAIKQADKECGSCGCNLDQIGRASCGGRVWMSVGGGWL